MSDLYVADLVIASPSLRGAISDSRHCEGGTTEAIHTYGGNRYRRTCRLLRHSATLRSSQ